MALRKACFLVILATALLLLPGVAAAEGIQRSTDEKGTIKIGSPRPAGEEKAPELIAPFWPVAPEESDSAPQAMPGRRSRQSVLRDRDKVFGRRVPPAPPPGVHQTPTTPAPPAQHEEQPPDESP